MKPLLRDGLQRSETSRIELDRAKLDFEIKKVELEQLRSKRESKWTSPLMLTLVTGVIGIFASGIANYSQGRAALSANLQKAQSDREKAQADQELERQKNEGNLILKAIDTQDPTKAANLLVFLAKNEIIRDPHHKIAALEQNPSSAPTLPTNASSGTIYVNPCTSDLVPYVASRLSQLIADANQANIEVHVDRGCQSLEQQAKLYALGRTTSGPKVTSARPGTSVHNCGLAFDLAIVDGAGNEIVKGDDYRWKTVGAIARKLGLDWGGDWKPLPDVTHFQQPGATCRISALRDDGGTRSAAKE